MSIQEKDRAALADLKKEANHEQPEQRKGSFFRRPERDLSRPFAMPYWPLVLPVLLCAIIMALLGTHMIDLGTIAVSLTLSFNVNIAVAALILLGGAISLVPRAIKNPQTLRSSNTIISFVVVALVAVFFATRLADLGTFVYTLELLDINVIVILLLMIGLVVLALRGSQLAGAVVILLFLAWGLSVKGFGLSTFSDLFQSESGIRLLRTLMPPRWSYFSHVTDALFLTIQTAVAATIIGIVGALPLSILAARNTTPHPVMYNTIRLIVNTIRSVPALVIALLFIPFVGLGPAAGIMGLGVHSISVLTKLYAESFESVKPQPLEALRAVGANGLKTFCWGVFPQGFPVVASYSIYTWESNLRDATVVAFVGGGGIGFLLQSNLSLLDYQNVSVLLIVLIVTVALLDRLSDFVRSKII
ncbi:phosphonate ABC transporter, permease protein PhnE [Ktedonosporobacter rubrisoli]|uniref:phosphonate ABC transporter, permease protein PhnE n=1 Tax=Ktedonosporobacter rubrisoli TaxID=2509675 RepID=UPI001F5E21A6|nr:phosphonate ABC transporter, permease protein PhnE [Ktedonosporobacter rubrisoli]